jgi:hypothetical protein
MNIRRQDLIAALTQIQNHPAIISQDILSIHGCAPLSSETELRAAIEYHMGRIAKWSNAAGNKRRLLRAA